MKKNAFTLIEILAVLIIISILVILSIPSLSDMLEKSKEKSKREVIEMVKTAAEMYAIDYKIGLAEPIYISDLCKNYIKCPIKDPITDQPITGYLYSRIDKNNSYSRVFELKTGTPIILNDSILSTVGGKDISINKYSGNGLYKWGDKYIYRGGLTRSNVAGLTTPNGYLTDTISGTDVANFIKVPWENYAVGETCTLTTNKCYRIVGINDDGTIVIIRDRSSFNQIFDNTHNTAASINYSSPGTNYGYNTLLENIPTNGYPGEYRQYSNMYHAVYGSLGYEQTNLAIYKSILKPMDVCINRVSRYVGLNATDYGTTTMVTDSCNIIGKVGTGSIYPLKNKLVRSVYTEEYLNVSTESTCYTDYGHYQCRNRNYMFNNEIIWTMNPSFETTWSVRALFYGGAGHASALESYGFKPVMTLRKNLVISGGNGTAASPYVIAE